MLSSHPIPARQKKTAWPEPSHRRGQKPLLPAARMAHATIHLYINKTGAPCKSTRLLCVTSSDYCKVPVVFNPLASFRTKHGISNFLSAFRTLYVGIFLLRAVFDNSIDYAMLFWSGCFAFARWVSDSRFVRSPHIAATNFIVSKEQCLISFIMHAVRFGLIANARLERTEPRYITTNLDVIPTAVIRTRNKQESDSRTTIFWQRLLKLDL